MVDQKTRELSQDIFQGTEAFARLSVESVMDNYFLYLEPGNFIGFQRALSQILRQSPEIYKFQIVDYNASILFDSESESKERYSGEERRLEGSLVQRVKANYLSVEIQDGSVVYVKQDSDKEVSYVDFNENTVPGPGEKDRVNELVVPYDNAYAVIYYVDYSAMDKRLKSAILQIGIGGTVALLLVLMLSYMISVSVTNPLGRLKAGALKLATGDLKARVEVKGKDEIGVLGETFNKMAVDLEASMDAKLYQERVGKELELASQIQQQLLPKDIYSLPNLDMAGGLIPASEVGGDAFDFIPVDEGRTLAYLGDVTGHGVAAGIVSSIANALLYGFHGDLKDTIKKLNSVLREKTLSNVFMTMALMLWDEESCTLSYVNMGHPPVLFYKASENKVSEFRLPGMALSMVDNLEDVLKQHDFALEPGDVIMAYSDGLPEAADPQAKQYGLERLKASLQNVASDFYSAEAIKNAVLADVKQYIAGGQQQDDMTVLVLKRKGAEDGFETSPAQETKA